MPAVAAPIVAIDPGSPAAEGGLSAGEEVLAVDGHEIKDIIDWMWYSAEACIEVTVRGASGERTVTLEREGRSGWGIALAGEIFDSIRTCDNSCEFCFVGQLPPGLRAELYVKDDDYRLSFLHGNFITLTNLADSDMARLLEMRLSPLYVSVHAVDSGLRARLFGCDDGGGLERLDDLAKAGIEIHAQIVLVPGVNDGAALDETLAWLAERPSVGSVGVVPVGWTAHQRRRSGTVGASQAAAALDIINRWRAVSISERASFWVHAADEFYLLSGCEVPPAEDYDGFPQYENGIGLLRTFVDDLAALELPTHAQRETVLVTGSLFAGPLAGAVRGAAGVRVLECENRLFGGGVSVAGLLAGADIARAVSRDRQAVGGEETLYVVPDVVLNAGGVTLDDYTVSDVESASEACVRFVEPTAAGLLEALTIPRGGK